MNLISPSFSENCFCFSYMQLCLYQLLTCMHVYGKEIIAIAARQQDRRDHFMWQCELVFKIITFKF